MRRLAVHKLVTQVVEVAFPPRCAACGLRGYWVCDECLEMTPLFGEPRCDICSMPQHALVCDCDELPLDVDRFWAAGPYDGWLRNAIHDFKFRGETARAPSLAALLADACVSLEPTASLVPVPIHRSRKRQRGYDQVAILAHAIAETTRQPVCDLLTKSRSTPAQVGLSAAERSLNLMDAFELRAGASVPERIILIDDVATTGSTLSECARELRRAGAQSISAVVIAHGI